MINRNKTRGKVIKTSEKCFMHLNTAPELGSIGPNQTRRPFFGFLESSPLFGRVSVRETSEPAEHHEKRTLHPAVYLTLDHNNSINFTPERPQISKKKMWVFPALVIANLHFSRNHFGTSGNFGRVSVTSASFQELLETNGEFLHSQPNKRRIPVDLLKKKLKD